MKHLHHTIVVWVSVIAVFLAGAFLFISCRLMVAQVGQISDGIPGELKSADIKKEPETSKDYSITKVDEDTNLYTNHKYGFSFEYPKDWGGDIIETRELSTMDTGTNLSVVFLNQHDVNVSFFSDDYEEGVGEGWRNYYNPDDLSISGINKFFNARKINNFSINNKKGVIVLSVNQYGQYVSKAAYLLPGFVDNKNIENVIANNNLQYSDVPVSQKQLDDLYNSQEAKNKESMVIELLRSVRIVK